MGACLQANENNHSLLMELLQPANDLRRILWEPVYRRMKTIKSPRLRSSDLHRKDRASGGAPTFSARLRRKRARHRVNQNQSVLQWSFFFHETECLYHANIVDTGMDHQQAIKSNGNAGARWQTMSNCIEKIIIQWTLDLSARFPR